MSEVAVALPQKTKRKRSIVILSAVLFAAWLGFVGYINWAMHQSPEVFGNVMKRMPMPAYFLFPFETMWTRARHGDLEVGSAAPDFDLQTYDESGRVQLSSFRGKQPVVLEIGRAHV